MKCWAYQTVVILTRKDDSRDLGNLKLLQPRRFASLKGLSIAIENATKRFGLLKLQKRVIIDLLLSMY
jgi:hypothetical protein